MNRRTRLEAAAALVAGVTLAWLLSLLLGAADNGRAAERAWVFGAFANSLHVLLLALAVAGSWRSARLLGRGNPTGRPGHCWELDATRNTLRRNIVGV